MCQVAEVGELSEVFQWRGEVERGLPGLNSPDRCGSLIVVAVRFLG